MGEGSQYIKRKQKTNQKQRQLTRLRANDTVQRVESTGDRDNMGDMRVALAIIGRREVIAEVGEVANDALVEIGEVLFGEGVSIKACGIRTAFEQRLDLMMFEPMVVIGVVETTRSRRRNSRDVREWVRCWWTVSGRLRSRDAFIGGIDCGGVAIDSDRCRAITGRRKVSPSRRARRVSPGRIN